jgi:hypothetical protein
LSAMSESLRFTAIYEDAGDGWVMARIAELPEVITQGTSEEEARQMVQPCGIGWSSTCKARRAGPSRCRPEPGASRLS